MSNIYGISLGATQACIATLDKKGFPEVIRNQCDASDTLATAVFFESADSVVIGNSAKDMVETDGERVVQFSHRELGKSGSNRYTFDGKEYGPEEINALFLGRLRQMAEEQGYTGQNVVLAIPTYFGANEKAAAKRICDLAGFDVVRIIPEPVAAVASYFGRRVDRDRTILVFDLGGGSLDITILKITTGNDQLLTEDSMKVLATGGNDMLGGKDWDDKLFDFILQACCDENALLPDEIDAETRQMIRSRIETTKKKLSSAESVKVKVNVNGAMTNIPITRTEFENLTADKVSQAMNCVEDVLQKAGSIEIDTVLLVGGSTFMPMIRNAVEARFPGKVQIEDPDRAIAKGAAVYGGMVLDLPFERSNPKETVKSQPFTQNNTQNLKNDNKIQSGKNSKQFYTMLLKYALEHFLGDLTDALIESLDFKSCTTEELFQITVMLHRPRKSNFHIEGFVENNRISSITATDIKTGQSFVYNLADRATEQIGDYQTQCVRRSIDVAYARKQMEYAALAIDEFHTVLADRILSSIPWKDFDAPDIAYILRGAHSFFQNKDAKDDCLKVELWESKLVLT